MRTNYIIMINNINVLIIIVVVHIKEEVIELTSIRKRETFKSIYNAILHKRKKIYIFEPCFIGLNVDSSWHWLQVRITNSHFISLQN
jgi:hypothetical protein